MGRPLRFAAVGAGFWSRYQLSAWRELPGATCVALCDRDLTKARALAEVLQIPAVHDDADRMLRQERPDFLEVITTEESHVPLVRLAAAHGVPVICQKPMAPSWEAAQEMVALCRERKIPFFIHENFRFQAPMREVKRLLDAGRIGVPYRARIQMVSGFPPFTNQPNLKELERFILTDVGSHVLDLARFFFGEADRLFCTTTRVHRDIKGEDVATVVLRMRNEVTVVCEMALAETPIERDAFPETFLFIEATEGSLDLGPGCCLRVTTRAGTEVSHPVPVPYPWADPRYLVAHASMVACNADLLGGIRGEPAETTGEDNLKTVEMVFASYESARRGEVVVLSRTCRM